MTLLEFLFIVSWVVIFITALDIVNKRRFNALHFLIFLLVWWALITFSVYPNALDKLWKLFWVARWADVLVYVSILFLMYSSLLLFKKNVDNADNVTKLVRELAINNSRKVKIKWKVVFLVRVYNEEQVLKKVLQKIFSAWYENILVINDGSTDNSKNILEKFDDKIILLNHSFNRWAWSALETWFEYLRRYWEVEYVITFDADWQHNIEDATKFIKKLDENRDIEVIFGSRFMKWAKTNVPFWRKIILFWWKIFTTIVSQIHLTDSHNWYRAFRYDVLNKISLKIDSMAYASELIDNISTKNIKYSEVPVDILYTPYSISKWQKSYNAISIAFKTIWNKFFR